MKKHGKAAAITGNAKSHKSEDPPKKDINRGVFFIKHYFTQQYQHQQFKKCKENLRDNEMVVLQDFSNLLDCTPQDEIKAAHYGGAAQITAHPSIVYAKIDGIEIKMVITHVSDIKKHDAHMVDHITTDILDIVQKKIS